MVYEALYYGWDDFHPGYFLIGEVEGETPEHALAENIEALTDQVIGTFELEDDASTRRKIQETLYVLREDGLVSKRILERSKS